LSRSANTALGEHWGTVCGSPEVASRWADRLVGECKTAWDSESEVRASFKGATGCLSALLAAGRPEQLLELLALSPSRDMWLYRQFGVMALGALGRSADAIRLAEDKRRDAYDDAAIARVCEEMLLAAGEAQEAYERYGMAANETGTHIARFRTVLVAKATGSRRPYRKKCSTRHWLWPDRRRILTSR
jgi:hypothetical protein